MKTYFKEHKGYFMTGDSACRDQEGYYRILGRVDDVVNVSGHRLSTAEIESALLDSWCIFRSCGCWCRGPTDRPSPERVFLPQEPGCGRQKEARLISKTVYWGSDWSLCSTQEGISCERPPQDAIRKNYATTTEKDTGGGKGPTGRYLYYKLQLLQPAVVSNIIDEINEQTQSGSEVINHPDTARSSDESNSFTHSPYYFPAYNLTSLDHILPPCHIFMFLSFEEASMEGIDALRQSVIRLSEHFPFLTGMVVPSSQSLGKAEVFEVKSASLAFLQKYPMLQVAFSPEMDKIAQDDFIQQKYLPIPFLSPPSRAYASGVSVVLKTLSEFCRAPEATLDSLSTSDAAEKTVRQHIIDFRAKEPLPFKWTSVPLSLDATTPEDHAQEPVSRHFSLSTHKVALLKDYCNKIITSESHGDPEKSRLCTSNDIITALVGFCGNKARQEIVPETVSPPRVIIAANVRKQCRLPPNYMGNALVAVEATYDSLRQVHGMSHLGFPANLSQNEVDHVCSIAIALREQIGQLSESYLQGILHNISDRNNLSSFYPAYGRSIIVSSLRWMDFYSDFGPMGRVQKYGIPETKVKGMCWVLPVRDLGVDVASQPFDLRFVLERGAMECLQQDGLFTWMMTE
ncbi:unnamed protein product [Penicillium nalgiovense]|nr:unnamed protein product [Penicillium nalgiovense]